MPDSSPSREPEPSHERADPTLAPGWYRVRRTVKFRNVVLTGAVLGFLIGALIAMLGPSASPRASALSAMAFVGLAWALVGALIAGVVAVLLDRRG